MFLIEDALQYALSHEAVIGRYVVNGPNLDLRPEWVYAVSVLAQNIILIQQCQNGDFSSTASDYASEFARHGFSFRIVAGPEESYATGAQNFIMRAEKR